jgi:hypothetical protein
VVTVVPPPDELVLAGLLAPPVPCDVAPVAVVDGPLVVLEGPAPALVLDVVSPPAPWDERVTPTSPEQPATIAPHTTSHRVQPKCKIPAARRGTRFNMAQIHCVRRCT